MKSFPMLLVVAVGLASAAAPAPADDLKDSIISGYRDRCIEVRSKAGGNGSDITASCNCEASVVKANYSTFELLSLFARGQIAKGRLPEEEIAAFRRKIAACNSRIEPVKAQ